MAKKKQKKKKKKSRKRYSKRRFRLTVAFLGIASIVLVYLAATLTIHYFDFSRKIELGLQGKQEEKSAWVYARTAELRAGQRISSAEVVEILNALRYRQVEGPLGEPGSFSTTNGEIRAHLARRSPFGDRLSGSTVALSFDDKWVSEIRKLPGGERLSQIELEPIPVTTLFSEERAKQRWVPLHDVPQRVIHAVVATEDQRFFEHTGLDPIGILRAALEDLRTQELRQGGSTLTQQLVKNYFLTPERTLRRKLLEAFLAIILESRATKEEILELYLNDVYLGQRGSFAIHGVGQAARIFFGKDVRNLDLSEAALVAALIRSPNRASPFRHPERARERRDIVLAQMENQGLISSEEARAATERPIRVHRGSVDVGEAPYFIDALRQDLLSRYSADSLRLSNLSVLSTLDYYLQSAAQRAITEGLDEIHKNLPGKVTDDIQASLLAIDPNSGDILALVGGKSYGQSQFNRALNARRQPGSAFKPFVYLAAFEQTYERTHAPEYGSPRPLATPTTLVNDEPTTFHFGNRSWSPQNYSRRFEGPVTYRQALARSLNVATAKVGEEIGFQRVVELWEAMDMSSRLEPYPSLVLGTFEVTPAELAAAYAVIANGGVRVVPRFFKSIRDENERVLDTPQTPTRRVVHAESAFLVTSILQSAIDEGTGREIRARGFKADVAGKTGTTDDARDAWFVGFVPDLLVVVWVGYDDNRKLGLTGARAALPIWTRFMKAAVSGRPKGSFAPPSGITHARIDPTNGMIATPSCPSAQQEVFLTGTEPRRLCNQH